jgi:pyruvate formate-lyase/glycerol dehydratase family glycyl radical enzyme
LSAGGERVADRVAALKERHLAVEQEVCAERARYFTDSFRRTEAEPMILRRARALANVLENMTVFIEPRELIAGKQAGALRAAPVFPEFAVDWIFEEIDGLAARPADRFTVRPEVREELLEICRYWQGKTVQDRCQATLLPEVKEAYRMGVLSATGNMTSGDGHILLDFPKVLAVGVQGIIGEAEERLERLDPADPGSVHRRHVLRSIPIVYAAVIRFAERYAELAERLAASEAEAARRGELERIARACRRVPARPPESFHEALQSVWFIHLISQIESNGHSMSLGRLDQYLLPFYLRDREAGRLTDAQAEELLACLWIQLFGITKIRPWTHTRFSAGGPTYQNLTLGGVDQNGADATNRLTFLCLDSVARTRLPQPNVSVRLHSGSPAELLDRCIQVIGLGFGMPALHNDELMIPSLLSRGVSLEDARGYAIVGCIEPIIPGKQGYRSAGMSFTNFPKILELALHGGRDPLTGVRLRPDERTLASCSSFEEVLDAFRVQMAHFVRLRIAGEHVIDAAIEELVPEPFCTGLVQDCLQRGQTPKEGGSVYDLVTGPETGVTNAANSLAAIRELVFARRSLNGGELAAALDGDFTGGEGEQIRQMLLNKAPKFGNDEDAVDSLAREVYLIFIRELEKYRTARHGRGPVGCLSYPCTATISANVPSGLRVGASADGRKAGEALAEGGSPYHGTDLRGPTAVLNSVAKMPNILITGGNLLNQRLHPACLASAEGRGKLGALVRTFFEKQGWHIQFNVISSATLRAAQREPEMFRDLVVRVAGYSALFNNLEPATQEDIIARTEHVL